MSPGRRYRSPEDATASAASYLAGLSSVSGVILSEETGSFSRSSALSPTYFRPGSSLSGLRMASFPLSGERSVFSIRVLAPSISVVAVNAAAS